MLSMRTTSFLRTKLNSLPTGAFYLLIDVCDRIEPGDSAFQFALDLLKERHVAVAPGSAFGAVAQGHVRISLGAQEQDIAQGVRALCAFACR
jgi:aspartate aminotransferase